MGIKRVVVMGATGFIGTYLVENLLGQNYSVTILVRHKARVSSHAWKGKVSILEWDGVDPKALKVQETGYDTFFFAAWDGVAPEHKNDVGLQVRNITYALNSMELAKKLGCSKFVATGTVAEYVFCENTIDVNEKPAPSDFYGAAKVSVHYMLEVLARQISMDFIWAVLPSTFGPGRKGNNIITYTICTLLKKQKPRYGDLEQLWDFLYVTEVAKALRLIGEKGKPGKIYGIGSGQYRKLREYVEEIRDCIDPQLELEIGVLPDMTAKTFSSCVNIFDLIQDTGFQIETSFGEGIKETILFIKENM